MTLTRHSVCLHLRDNAMAGINRLGKVRYDCLDERKLCQCCPASTAIVSKACYSDYRAPPKQAAYGPQILIEGRTLTL